MVSSDNFFGDAARVAGKGRDPRDAVIARELESAREPALAAALEAFALLKLLPRAFADSQRRELQRVRASDDNGKDSPRVQSLLQSIEQAETLRGTSELGLARVERMLSLQDTDAQLVHGFVSDSQLRPLPRLRVQLQLDNDKPRSASTGEDGYFRIELGDRKSRADVGSLAALFARGAAGAKIDAKNAQVNAAAAAAAAATTDGPAGKLSIHDANGTLLYADPDAIALDAGTVYREYLISGEPADDGDPPPPPRGRAATGTTANDTKAKDAATAAATTKTAASTAAREDASSAATKAADPTGATADTKLAEAKPAATAATQPATKTATKAAAAQPALKPRASAPKGPTVTRSRKAPATPPKGKRK